MGLAVLTNNASSVDGENDRQVLNADIVEHLVKCTLQEGRVDSNNRNIALGGEAGSEGHCMLLTDTNIEDASGELLSHQVQTSPFHHGSGNRHHPLVFSKEAQHGLAEDFAVRRCIAAGGAFG